MVIVFFALKDIKVFTEDSDLIVAASWWQFFLIAITPLSLYLILNLKLSRKIRWSDTQVLRLNEFANNGESIEFIAAQLSSEDELITVQSVRSKLVSIGA